MNAVGAASRDAVRRTVTTHRAGGTGEWCFGANAPAVRASATGSSQTSSTLVRSVRNQLTLGVIEGDRRGSRTGPGTSVRAVSSARSRIRSGWRRDRARPGAGQAVGGRHATLRPRKPGESGQGGDEPRGRARFGRSVRQARACWAVRAGTGNQRCGNDFRTAHRPVSTLPFPDPGVEVRCADRVSAAVADRGHLHVGRSGRP